MYHGEIVIHDGYGWTQADRRASTLTQLAAIRARHLEHLGQDLTWTEEPDGLTFYVNGAYNGRLTWAEVAAAEPGMRRTGAWHGVD